MMESLMFFLLFSAAVTVRAERLLLTERSVNRDDFLRLVDATSGRFDKFYGKLEPAYQVSNFRRFRLDVATQRSLPAQSFHQVRTGLTEMIKMFMDYVEMYVGWYVIKMCNLGVRLINRGYFTDRHDILKEMELPDDRVFCVITAMHDWHVDAEMLFEAIYFLRTIDRDSFPTRDLLESYSERLELYFTPPTDDEKNETDYSRNDTNNQNNTSSKSKNNVNNNNSGHGYFDDTNAQKYDYYNFYKHSNRKDDERYEERKKEYLDSIKYDDKGNNYQSYINSMVKSGGNVGNNNYKKKEEKKKINENYEKNFAKFAHPPLFPNLGYVSSAQDQLNRLHQARKGIMSFSQMFCPRWPPFVNHGFLSRTASHDVQNQSNFIRHVYLDERCTILDGIILNKNSDLVWYNYYPGAVSSWIKEWSCRKILKSQMYGFERYRECPKKVRRVIPGASDPAAPKANEFSLAALKLQLKSNNISTNVLIYYKIVADVMLLASIKEGNKTIKGIKLVARWTCANINDYTLDTIRGLRTSLFAFKSKFDEFVARLQHERRQSNVEQNAQKREFDARVKTLMRTMDARYDTIKMSCGELQTFLNRLPPEEFTNNGDSYPAGNPTSVMKFRWYYFDEPLLHVGQLYSFDAFGF